MKKIILILMAAALMSSCVSHRTCPTYSYEYKNLNKGTFGVVDSDVLYYPGDVVCQLPDKTKFLIVDVKLN